MLSQNAIRVLERRYLRHAEDGRPSETPEQLFRRVAGAVAAPDQHLPFEGRRSPEATAESFYRMLSGLEFLPNSPTLMNAGRPAPQLAACFVLPVEDSMEGIFDSLKHTAIIHKTGGGTGFSFSRLRPRNSPVRSTNGIASGPVSFMKVFNAATEAVKQGGARRGANMGILRVDHPDILEFIRCKREGSDVANFNISVAITEEFMKALREGDRYRLKGGAAGAAGQTLDAREIFAEIVDCAWVCGDPGVLFIDRINQANPTKHAGEIEATNPCGEQPLLPNESCVLGSVNLGLMLGAAGLDWERLARTARCAVHFLDNVIEANSYPLPEIEQVTKANRRIGVGVMGWADLLVGLGIPYDSTEAVTLGGQVMAFLDEETKRASAALAAERGAFPNWKGSSYDLAGGPVLRNATTTTVAPTGTISIIAGASSGIEPIFALSYTRRHILDDEELSEVYSPFRRALEARGLDAGAILARCAAAGSARGVEEIPEELRRIFVTAHDVAPSWHVKMQAAFQRHCDNGVSKTVNLPRHATREDVREVYLLAHSLGCKGVTIFRDGCRDRQVLNHDSGTPATTRAQGEPPPGNPAREPARERRALNPAGLPPASPRVVSGRRRSGPTPDTGPEAADSHRTQDGAASSSPLPTMNPSSGRKPGDHRLGEPPTLPQPILTAESGD